MNRLVGPAVWLLVALGCMKPAGGQSSIRLDDVTRTAGVRFEHFSGGSGKHYIVETVTSGLATFDYDDDGLIDIYLLSGAPLPNVKTNFTPTCKLFRNLGDFRFIDVTAQSGAGEQGFALGVAAADYDNDGDQDLFVSNFGPNVMLVNNGDGTFARQMFPSSDPRPRVGAGVSLLDIEGDGALDLYFANYIKFSYDLGTNRTIFGVPAAPGPKDYEPDTHLLLSNDFEGGWRDISQASGIADYPGPGMATVAFDFDQDRDTDLFVCNDSAANFLFENLGESQFSEIGVLAGVAYDVTGAQQATMGADVADFDGDGHLDIVTTSFIDEFPTLGKNSGSGFFDDVAAAAGLGRASRNVTWGVGFSDFDNDTWPDLFIASGHLIAGVTQINDTEKFAAPNLVFRNLGGKRFVDVSRSVGSAGSAVQVSRGIAIDDLDNDGRPDVVVLNLNDQPQIIRNQTPNAGNYLQLELVGTHANRDAVGSRVSVRVGNRTLVQEVIAGRGYQSHFGSRLSFGLGDAKEADQIEIQWHGGETQRLGRTQSNQLLLIPEAQAPVRLR